MTEATGIYPAVELTALSLNQVLNLVQDAGSAQNWYDSLTYREKCYVQTLLNHCRDFIDLTENMDE